MASLEAIGPVNPLAVEEHAEETKRLEFLTSQRDDLVAKILDGFLKYSFPPEMSKALEGTTRFFPITYEKQWDVVRKVADAVGEKFTVETLKSLK